MPIAKTLLFALAGSLLTCVFTAPLLAETAGSADAFVDSVGVNIHLHYSNTSYSDFPHVKQALKDLGVRHVRDGLVDTKWKDYYTRHNDLGSAGIKGLFITAPNESDDLLLDYPERMKQSFEGYEAPNEYDQSRDSNWPATLSQFITRLNKTVKGDPNTSRFQVIGPSFTSQRSYQQMRGVCSFDFSNLHNYFGGRNPGTDGWGSNGYGSYAWNLSNASSACPGKAVISTETGYQTDPTLTQGISDEVAGKYLPRLLLEQWMHGIQRTYVYELIDLPDMGSGDKAFGLVRSDFSQKPSYMALMNLLHLLSDPGEAYTGKDFGFSLSGEVADVQHVLLQKRDGTFFIALWIEKPGYNVNHKQVVNVPTQNVTLQTDKAVAMVAHSFGTSGNVRVSALDLGTSHSLKLSDYVTVLEIDGLRPLPPVLHAVVH
ncbi:MAG TPA: hypothetical protein VH088_11725 [Terriglobales bacterium]|jgi:hypothetical protein|nr:hypothetical protein [Terriglobales bacterium]